MCGRGMQRCVSLWAPCTRVMHYAFLSDQRSVFQVKASAEGRLLRKAHRAPSHWLGRCNYWPEAAPLLSTTFWQTLWKFLAHAAATRCACWEWHTLFTRALYATFPKGGFLATKSFKSRLRSFRRSHPQKSSTGFRSGDCLGICHKVTLGL